MYELPDLQKIEIRVEDVKTEFEKGTPEIRMALIDEVKADRDILDARLKQVILSVDGDKVRALRDKLTVLIGEMQNYD